MNNFLRTFFFISTLTWFIFAIYREIILGDNAGSERALTLAFISFLLTWEMD